MSRPRRRFASLRALVIAPALLALTWSQLRDARAAWPPPPGATPQQLMDPANWPNDPDYGPRDSKGMPSISGTGGMWQYWSWIPPHDAAHPFRKAETATGMSVDVAWTYTIGDPRVKIAVIDSGIKWDERELVHKAALNEKELVNAKPLTDAGAPCGGTGELAGFDCNGDGIFDMYDYEVSAKGTLKGKTGAGELNDANGNGLLDPGDLIQLFSDGKDDDGNGYVDDICGWDFFKDDNDAYDDTRYGHGTGEARDSVGEANNGAGSEGVCPKCRYVPLRAGDSFIADVQGFAKSAVYATDNGVSVIQCAMGTVNMSQFSRAAIDYAYAKHVTVISSAADENSRHHNMPAAANHTVVVHAIRPDRDEPSQASTYLLFHPCSNFGGEKILSASGDGCASEATARSAGTAGLVYSMALKAGTTDITAEEVKQLMVAGADLIDVPESYDPNNANYAPDLYYESKPTFSQRFGYGRLNVGKTMKMIADGKIPPEVDLLKPSWFEVIYRNKQTTDVPLNGVIRAARASTYDAVVEWAPGVEPDENLYKVVTTIPSQPGTKSLGADGTPLAFLKLADIPEINNAGEVENKFAITVRIRAKAHYGGAIGDVPGETRRTLYVINDPSIVDGWPKNLGTSGEGSPRLVDLDGDGKREVLYPTSDGVLHAYKGDGKELWAFKTRQLDGLQPTAEDGGFVAHYLGGTNAYTRKDINLDLAREAFPPGAPAIGDIDGDGKKEIVFGTYAGTLYAIHTDGTPLGGKWPIRLPDVPSCPRGTAPALPAGTKCMDEKHPLARGAVASLSLADMDKDGKLDVISAAFDGNIYVFKGDGSPMDGWPVEVRYDGDLPGNNPGLCTAEATAGRPCLHSRIITTPAIGDLNGDGIPDIAVGTNQYLGKGNQLGAFFAVDGRGSKTPSSPYMPGWPVITSSIYLFPLVGEGIVSAGMMADMDGDGKPEVIFHGTGSTPLVLPAHPVPSPVLGGSPTNAVTTLDPNFGELYVSPTGLSGNNMIPVFSQPSVGDLDQDGHPDIVAYGASFYLALALNSSERANYEQQTAMWSGAPATCTDQSTGKPFACSKMFPGSPTIIEDYTFFHNGTIADVNGDDYPEVLVGTGGYYVRAFDACGREATGFPKFTGQWVIPSPTVGDIDGDGKLEVVTGTRDGFLYAWHTEGKEDGVIEWPTYHHDLQNTGNLSTKLDFPGKKATKPLDLTKCAAPVQDAGPIPANPSVEGGGGCSCETAGGSLPARETTAGLLAGLGALGLVLARRRRS
jgi:MYXO-CTERM domain-containing protein